MDAFFASVEQRDHPEYRGKPVIVGAAPGSRGVVSAASYEARKFGIHSAMPINRAFSLCSQGIYVRPAHEKYSSESNKLMDILKEFSPKFEQVSVDEAFLDMTGTEKLWGAFIVAAKKIKTKIGEERGLTASIGIAPNKYLAKIASDLNKPDGISEVPFNYDEIIKWLAPMAVKKMGGVGKKREEILNSMGLRTIGELQKLTHDFLEKKFGKGGTGLFHLCRGIDSREVKGGGTAKSISREYTFDNDTKDRVLLKKTLLTLSQDVSRRAREGRKKGKTVVLTYRTSDFKKCSKRVTFSNGLNTAKEIYETAVCVLDALPGNIVVRLIGVGLTSFCQESQIDLFGMDKDKRAWEESEKALDILSAKFGRQIIKKGGEIKKK